MKVAPPRGAVNVLALSWAAPRVYLSARRREVAHLSRAARHDRLRYRDRTAVLCVYDATLLQLRGESGVRQPWP